MTYLSCSSSPLENLTHLAHHPASVTKEHAEALKTLNDQKFPIKIRTLQITAIAIMALGILVAATVKVISGIIVASVSILSFLALKYQMGKQAFLQSEVEQTADAINVINQSIIEDLKNIQTHKEETLISLFNGQLFGLNPLSTAEHAKQIMDNCSRAYDGQIIHFVSAIDTSKCQMYLKMMPLVQSILNQKTPSTLSSEKWAQFQKACFIFLHGEAGVTEHGWSKNEPYIQLEKTQSGHWIAKKY